MARIVITRPNGETEYAELTTDKAQAGNDRLAVEKDGTTYYAKLDSGVSTHMFVIKPDGRKLYVQKEVKFVWKYMIDGDIDKVKNMVIPRTGKYRLTFTNEKYSRYTGNTQETTFSDDDIFNQGDRFDEQTIKARSGKKYHYYNYWESEPDEGDNPNYEYEDTTLASIEYIGEA